MSEPLPGEPRRVSGLGLLLAIVVVGLASGAGFYRWKRGEMEARLAADLAGTPTQPAERLALWLRFGGPQIHHRLAVVGRFTAELPWLVTHAVASAEGPPELWGVDCAALPLELAHVEGMQVVIELPHPRALGRATLEGERAQRVPLYAPEVVADGEARLSAVALSLLESMPDALARDIPGATLVIRVAHE